MCNDLSVSRFRTFSERFRVSFRLRQNLALSIIELIPFFSNIWQTEILSFLFLTAFSQYTFLQFLNKMTIQLKRGRLSFQLPLQAIRRIRPTSAAHFLLSRPLDTSCGLRSPLTKFLFESSRSCSVHSLKIHWTPFSITKMPSRVQSKEIPNLRGYVAIVTGGTTSLSLGLLTQ